jgi:hypothetical protein
MNSNQMSNLEIAIQQAKLQNALQDAANRHGWDSPEATALGGFDAFDVATSVHDEAFRALDKQERRQYMASVD